MASTVNSGSGDREKGASFESDLINELIYKYKVVVFGKSNCPFTRRAKELLAGTYGLAPEDELLGGGIGSNAAGGGGSGGGGEVLCFFDLDTDPRVQMIEEAREEGEVEPSRSTSINTDEEVSRFQDCLLTMTGERTVPRIFIGAQCIGGTRQLEALDRSGQLAVLLREAGVELPIPSSSGGAKSPETEAADAGSHHARLAKARGSVPSATGASVGGQPRQPLV